MKSVLMSIQPKWCELIASGKKTVEVRKTAPKIATPFKVYIYCTKPKGENDLGLCLDKGMSGNLKKVGLVYKRNYETANRMNMQILSGKVIGEFICDEITCLGNVSTDPWCALIGDVHEWHKQLVTKYACLTEEELLKYGGKYAWHISNLVIYDEPRKLGEFIRICPEWEKGEITEKCLECEHLYRSPIENLIDCDYEGEIPITRPPQSWCYIESEVEGE